MDVSIKMPLDDGPFPCGRTYVYIVRTNDTKNVPLKMYLSYSYATKAALNLAQVTKIPHHIDVYEEAYDHVQMKYCHTYSMSETLDMFVSP